MDENIPQDVGALIEGGFGAVALRRSLQILERVCGSFKPKACGEVFMGGECDGRREVAEVGR